MIKRILGCVVVGASLTASGSLLAHHSVAGAYDLAKEATIAGSFSAFRLVNPHALMTVDVADEAGKVVTWEVEFDGRLNLTNGGWNDKTIAVGERLSVTGNPTHTGSPRLFFVRLERGDGSVLLRPGIAKIQSLENERRQRAEQRRQQTDAER